MDTTTLDWILNHFGSFGVGGISGAVIAFLLLKSFLPSYFQEKAKNLATREDIAKITDEIEKVRLQYSVFLQHDSRIHEKQLNILCQVFKHLFDVLEYAKLSTKSAIYENENPDEYPKLMGKAFFQAYEEFLLGQLFLPQSLVEQIQSFFEKAHQSQVYYNLSKSPSMPNGPNRAEHWKQAGTIAFTELPAILKAIELEARAIIHSHSHSQA